MTRGTYGFGVSCPRCGGHVEHVSTTKARDPWWTSGVCRCVMCGTDLFIRVTLEVVRKPHAEYQRQRRASQREKVA